MIVNHYQILNRLESKLSAITELDHMFDIVVSKIEDLVGKQFAYKNPAEFIYTDQASNLKYDIFTNEALDKTGMIMVNIGYGIGNDEYRTIAILSITSDGEFTETYERIPLAIRSRIFSLFTEIEIAINDYVLSDDNDREVDD